MYHCVRIHVHMLQWSFISEECVDEYVKCNINICTSDSQYKQFCKKTCNTCSYRKGKRLFYENRTGKRSYSAPLFVLDSISVRTHKLTDYRNGRISWRTIVNADLIVKLLRDQKHIINIIKVRILIVELFCQIFLQ